MSNNGETIQELGYDSWLQLYEELVLGDIHILEQVRLVYPTPPVNPMETGQAPVKPETKEDVILELDYVRSMAFQEIYPGLPLREEIEENLSRISNGIVTVQDANPINNFLNKLPTRAR